jgi:hypothetical protein
MISILCDGMFIAYIACDNVNVSTEGVSRLKIQIDKSIKVRFTWVLLHLRQEDPLDVAVYQDKE